MRKKYFVIFFFVLTCLSCRTLKNNFDKVIFSDIFHKKSSLLIFKNHIQFVDSSDNESGEIVDVTKSNFVLKKDTIIEIDGNLERQLNDAQSTPVISLWDYKNIGDINLLSDTEKEMIDSTKEIHDIQKTRQLIIYTQRDNNGNCFLFIKKKEDKMIMKINLGNYLDYFPEIFLHDLDGDGFDEIFVFAKFYMQNHYLVEVKVYKPFLI